MSDPFAAARELEAAQAKEYGTYVAAGPIDVLGVRAFNTGDPVPVGHVERGVVAQSQVVKVGTKAAAALTEV
jgi:hypothetical protein